MPFLLATGLELYLKLCRHKDVYNFLEHSLDSVVKQKLDTRNSYQKTSHGIFYMIRVPVRILSESSENDFVVIFLTSLAIGILRLY